MDIRHGRGRGGHWRRGGGGGGGGDSGGAGEPRGRGRGGHHRGRGKRDHHRGRGQYHLPAADFRRNQNQGDHDDDEEENHEEELDNTIFSRRKLKSNWDRYEESEKVENEKDVPTQRGTDYHVLLTSAGDSYAQFRFSDEKDWEMDSLAKNQVPALFIDLSALTQSLEKLPLHTRLNLEPELVQEAIPVQLPSMTAPRRTDSTPAGGLKALRVGRDSGLAISSAVKFVPGPTPSPSVSPAIQHPIEDTDTELDLLLSLQKPTQLASGESITTMDDTPNIPVTVAVEEEKKEKTVDVKDTKQEVKKEAESTIQELTEEDLEDWLDSMIS